MFFVALGGSQRIRKNHQELPRTPRTTKNPKEPSRTTKNYKEPLRTTKNILGKKKQKTEATLITNCHKEYSRTSKKASEPPRTTEDTKNY